MAIPKKIHYCWFGGNPKPELALKCIKSWKKYCPDYEIIEWNESNFDVNANQYCRDAYKEKKWAFVTDYARLVILYEHGGVYFDTDVQVIRSIDALLEHPAFMGIERASDSCKVASGLALGSEKGNPLIKEIMDDYDTASFYRSDGSIDITTCTVRNSETTRLCRRGSDPAHSQCGDLLHGVFLPHGHDQRQNAQNQEHLLYPPLQPVLDLQGASGRTQSVSSQGSSGRFLL